MTYSIFAYSEYAYGDAPAIDFFPEALRRLATARTSNPILFLEISARENTVTLIEDILEERPGLVIEGFGMIPYSAKSLPRVERETVSFLFSTRPWTGSPEDPTRANQRAIPRIISAGRISRTAPMDSSVTKRGQRTIGDARIANPDGALDYILTNYTMQGGEIKAWLGEPGDTSDQWALLYQATVEDAEASRQEIIVSISTIQDQLKRSLQTRRYTGGGGISGDGNVSGRLRPTCWGECFGIDPVLISEADRIYQIHDSSIQAVDAVYEGGLPYDFTADYPDYTALSLATLDIGEYATCLAYGLIRIGTTLEGLVYPLRVSAKGDNTSNGYVSSTGDILYRLARNRAFLTADQVDVNSFQGLPRGRVGYYTNGAQDVSIESVFDALLGGVVATYGVGRLAELQVSRMIPADMQLTDVTVNKDQIFDSRVEALPYEPRLRQPYYYSPTFAPVDPDQLSPLADSSLADRLQEGFQEGEYFQASTAAIVPLQHPHLVTYFVDDLNAQGVAKDALQFSARNIVPLRSDIGRIGLLVDIGGVIAIDESRFANDFRGVIYELEDNLGATITSRVVAVG